MPHKFREIGFCFQLQLETEGQIVREIRILCKIILIALRISAHAIQKHDLCGLFSIDFRRQMNMIRHTVSM